MDSLAVTVPAATVERQVMSSVRVRRGTRTLVRLTWGVDARYGRPLLMIGQDPVQLSRPSISKRDPDRCEGAVRAW